MRRFHRGWPHVTVADRRDLPSYKRYSRSLCRGIATCLLWQSIAQGEPSPLLLRWQAPADCPTGAEIEREVLHLVLPKQVFAIRLVANARAELDETGRYHLILYTSQAGVEGERSFTGQTCRAVSDAAIVTLALSLDPNLKLPKDFGSARLPAEPIEPTPVKAKPTAIESKVSLRPIAVTPWSVQAPVTQVLARSIVGWRWGSLPESSGELGVGLGLRRGRASAYLALSFSPTSSTAYSRELSTAGGKFAMQAGALAGCGAILDGSLRVAPCLGMTMTRVTGKGIGIEPTHDGTLYWPSAMAALESSYALGKRVGLYASFTGLLALHRPYAYLAELDTIFQPDPLAYQLLTGAELQIW